MLNHGIKENLCITYVKQTTASDAYISNDSTIDYLLSTPALIAMIIDASYKMLDKLLPDQYITVGSRVDIAHVNPTLIGETITITINVEKVEGNKIFLNIIVNDSNTVVCKGKCERIIVNKEKLMEFAYKRVALAKF